MPKDPATHLYQLYDWEHDSLCSWVFRLVDADAFLCKAYHDGCGYSPSDVHRATQFSNLRTVFRFKGTRRRAKKTPAYRSPQ